MGWILLMGDPAATRRTRKLDRVIFFYFFGLIKLAFSLHNGTLFSPFPVCRPNGLSGITPFAPKNFTDKGKEKRQ